MDQISGAIEISECCSENLEITHKAEKTAEDLNELVSG
jgi:hypothetical protein